MKKLLTLIFLFVPTLVWATPPNTTAVPLAMQTTPCSTTQLVIGAGTGNPPICGTIGTNLSFSGTTLNVTGTGAITSVFGRTGVVTATTGDYSSTQINGAIALSSSGNGGVTGTLPVGNGGTGVTSFTSNAPLIGGSTIGVGSRSGNTTTFATATGTLTNGHCVSIDSSGNFVDAGGACTTGGGGGTVSTGAASQLAYYATAGTTVSGLTTANNGVLVTNGSGVPSIGTTIPTAVQSNITQVGTIGTGTWQGSAVGVPYGGTGGTSFTAYSPIVGGTTTTGAFQSAGSLGVAGYILTSNGNAAVPTFQAPAGGTGTVTSASVVSANGFAGTVATATTTPAITLTTSITGVLKGNGTAISAATAGTDYAGLNSTNVYTGTNTFDTVYGTVTSQSGTTYTLAAADCGTEIAFTNASAITVTIPAALTTGCNIAILQTTSAGQVTVTGTAVSAATLHSAHSYTKTYGQWSIIGINIYTTGVAILTGDGA